jgi:hypothetical protein
MCGGPAGTLILGRRTALAVGLGLSAQGFVEQQEPCCVKSQEHKADQQERLDAQDGKSSGER